MLQIPIVKLHPQRNNNWINNYNDADKNSSKSAGFDILTPKWDFCLHWGLCKIQMTYYICLLFDFGVHKGDR